jgi:cell division protease FtsH
MDGFDSSVGLIILSATNRPEILDPALLRAGRFDRQVLVDRPDRKGRIDILKVHVRKVKLDPALNIENVAALTPGFSGADLANLVNEATLVATRRKADQVTTADFTVAVERIVAGLERHSRVLSAKEREAVAFHEMGHALVALAQKGSDPVHKVSIIPRGIGALGYTIQRPTEDRYLMTHDELAQKISILLGGRAAEKLIFGQLSTGAADDLAKATDIARDMVTRYGMDEGLGYVAFETSRPTLLDLPDTIAPHHLAVSQETQRRVDEAIRELVMGGFAQATALLTANRDLLEQGARALLEKETLDEADIHALTAQLKPGA